MSDKYDYLESERKKLWARLLELETEIGKKTSDYEKEAKQSSKKASEYRNKSNESYELAKNNAEIAQAKAEEAKQSLTLIKSIKTKSEDCYKKISDYSTELNSKIENITECIETLEENFENNSVLVEKLERLEENFEQGEEIIAKIEVLHKSIQPKKKEIDNLYREIFGYTDTQKDENDVDIEIKIEGLKDHLEDSYNDLSEELDLLKSEITKTKNETLINYNSFIKEKEDFFNKTLENWENEHDNVLEKINKLLPNALTAGLASAYSEKRESELLESKKYANNFRNAALGLIGMSLIPFILSVFFIWKGKSLHDVILDSPRFVLAIIPMYIPILWIAYSSNKKLNLSKRLIEEYTHKEVLSKTFEGLSHQINNIEDEDVSADLKIKLLYNILSVSSENPGKLISDYNKSDHPLMDALDKSASLSDAVEKLENIPGLSKIARILDKRARKLLKEQADKVNSTLGEIVEETLDEPTE